MEQAGIGRGMAEPITAEATNSKEVLRGGVKQEKKVLER